MTKRPQPTGANMHLRRVGWWLLTACDILPILVPAWIAAFGSVAVIFLLLGHLQTAPVVILGVLAAAAVSYPVIRYYPHTPRTNREWHVGNVLLIVGVLVWGCVNLPFTSEHVLTNRDPATYAVAGEWLIHHDNLQIPIPYDVFGHVENVVEGSAGFSVDRNGGQPFIYAQGLHLLPVLLGLIGRLVGQTLMLHGAILFGMAALMAVYGFARLIARARWALLATATLAASMPMLYFSRDAYTEPLAVAFTFGSLSLLWLGITRGKLAWWFLAGLVAGAGALARLDAHLAYVGLVLFFGIWVALATKPLRQRAVWQVVAASVGLIIPVVIGWLDAVRLSWPYYDSLATRFYEIILTIGAAAIAGVVLTWVARKTTLLWQLDRKTRTWREPVIIMTVIGFVLLLSCRPFVVWYFQHFQDASAQVTRAHSFSEITTYWISWYLGPIMTIAGVIGIALAAAWATMRRDLLLLASILVVTTTALVYLLAPNITPDQIWASRRFLPVVLPGVVVFGALTLDWFDTRYMAKERFGRYFAGLAMVSIFISALYVSSPLILTRDTAELAPVVATCAALPKNAGVLLVGTAREQLLQPIHTFCNLPAMAWGRHETDVPEAATLAQIAKNVRAAGKVPIAGVMGGQLNLLDPSAKNDLTKVVDYQYRQLEQTFVGPPQRVVTMTGSLYFGVIEPNGTIRPLPAHQ